MRYLTIVAFMFLYAYNIQSQTYEVGPYVGGANYIGDVGTNDYISPNSVVYGGLLRWNRSPRHSFRFTLLHTELEADDANGDPRRQQRGYEFSNPLTEASLGIEYTFWEWNLHQYKPQIVPYLYTGLTGIFTNDLYFDQNQGLVDKDEKITASIPMVIGVKGTLNSHWILSLEAGARYTFTDNIDGSNPQEFDGGENYLSFGNPNTNDWYMFVGVSLTYSFGRRPCYCNF